ncbi:hypothetical protein GALL_540330 [mine drainage metagenome]|uniref:Uncharacterized protein n=1 Tax=mine drainage metagenome TaxID=410659 RepID=A0A1J5NZZ7_9ZZZZ
MSRQDGTFVCGAGFEANKSAYFPHAYVDTLREKRREGQRQRLEAKAQRVLGEPLERPQVEVHELTDTERALAAEAFKTLTDFHPEPQALEAIKPQALAPSGRPIFSNDLDYYRWAKAHPWELDAQEAREVFLRIDADPALQAVLAQDDAPPPSSSLSEEVL